MTFEYLLKKDFFDLIKDNTKVAIFGACPAGKRILQDIKKYKKNIEIVCFIDNYIIGKYANLPIYSLKNFIEKDTKCSQVIFATKNQEWNVAHILSIYDYNRVFLTFFANNYYRNTLPKILTGNNLNKVLKIFKNKTDKTLYKILFETRLSMDFSALQNICKANYDIYSPNYTHIKSQYVDKINKNAIKTMIDLGFWTGLNAIAYNKNFPNLEHIYAFDVIYDKVKIPWIEDFIINNRLEIINICVGDKKKHINFYFDKTDTSSSVNLEDTSMSVNNKNIYDKIEANVILLDDFCEERNIKPDFIKSDIEGAEMTALKGAKKIIQKYRPQLAISIYHSNSDFIEIPLYLNEILENYTFKLGHYISYSLNETVLYAIPNELI